MRKIQWRFAFALIVVDLALVAAVFVNQAGKAESSADVDQVSENIFGVSSMPSVAGILQTSSSWFCPGVPASEKTVTSEIIVANSSDIPVTGKITYLSTDKPAASAVLVVQPFTRSVFDATGGRKSRYVSAIVELDNGGAAVEQRIIHPAGDSVALCANKPSDRWFFADGFTGAESLFNILLTNPFPDSTVVDVSFVTAEGKRDPASLKGIIIEPESVYSLSMGDEGARNEAVLAVSIRASSGRFVAGKLEHFLGRGRLGYSSSLGAPATSRQWWFAGGQKNLDTDEIFREPLVLTIPAGRVTTLETSSLPAITNGRYGILVTSITDDFVTSVDDSSVEFVVVEQVLTRKVEKSTGTTVTFGTPSGSPSRVWTIPSGVTAVGGSLIIVNATSLASTLKISTVGPAGAVAIEGFETVQLGSAAVLEVKVPPTAGLLQILVESDNEIVVQREITRGHDLVGFSSVPGLPYRSAGITNAQDGK